LPPNARTELSLVVLMCRNALTRFLNEIMRSCAPRSVSLGRHGCGKP
jgi:hypothetical protein